MRNKLIIILLFACLFSFSQDNTFIRTYNIAGMHGGLALEVMEDGGFVGTGQHYDLGGQNECRIYVYRINECGDIIWFNLYGGYGGGVAIDETNDNGVIIAADGRNLLKLDDLGDVEWYKHYSYSTSGYMTSVVQNSDGGYFSGGTSGQILKLDAMGEVIWSATISGDYVHALDEFPNGDLMYFSWNGSNSSYYIGRVTSQGVLIWENEYIDLPGQSSGDTHYNWAGEALIDKSTNHIIVASNTPRNSGDIVVTSIDYNGNVVASNIFGSTSNTELVRSIDLTDDGGYIIGGATYGHNTSSTSVLTQYPQVLSENLSSRDILLFKVDYMINFQWSSVIGSAGMDKAIGVRTNQDNGYTISAYTDGSFFGAGNNVSGWDGFDPLFIKTDSLGRVGCQQYSPVLNQIPALLTVTSTNNFTLNSTTASLVTINQDSISPTDRYMCLECNTTPFFTISDTTICVGDTTYFINQSSGMICFQDWYVDSIKITNLGDSIPFVFTTAGMHNVLLETNCGTGTLTYDIDFYVNDIQFTVDAVSDYNGYEISCYDFNDGYIQTTATSPFPPVVYNWSTTNPSSSDQYNLYDGVYNLQLTDNYGCVFDTSFIMIEPTPIISSYSAPLLYNGFHNICVGGQDGYIDLTVSGSVPNYIYQWSNGASTSNINNLLAGTYTYVVTDQNGCVTSDSIMITEPVLNIFDSVNHVSCTGGIDGSVSVSVSGSTPPYYIFWDNNINTSMLESGIYSCQIIDSIGCSYNHTVTVNDPLPFTVVEQVTDVSCFGSSDGSVALIITGATPPYSVDWFGYNTFGMHAGTYNFTIVDSNNCQYSEIVIVNEPNPIDVTFTITSPSCPNSVDGMVDLSISGGIGPYTENWNGYNPNSLSPGIYELVVLDANGCSDTNNISLVPLSDMLIVEYAEDVTCEGLCDGSVDLSISNGVLPYQSIWSDGQTTASASELCPGVFFFEVIDGLGCVYSDSVIINSPDSLEIINIVENNGFLTPFVSGGTPPIFYSWFSLVNQLGSGSTLNVSYIGDYYCIAYDSLNCQSDTAVYFYNGNPSAIIDQFDSGLDGLLIYPNPTDEILNIQFFTDRNIELKIAIIDVLGKRVMLESKLFFSGMYKRQIDLVSFARGVYFLEIRTQNTFLFKKVVLE